MRRPCTSREASSSLRKSSAPVTAARLATRLALYHDGDCLTALFLGEDDGVAATYLRHDEPLWREDVVELFLAPERPSCAQAQITSNFPEVPIGDELGDAALLQLVGGEFLRRAKGRIDVDLSVVGELMREFNRGSVTQDQINLSMRNTTCLDYILD